MQVLSQQSVFENLRVAAQGRREGWLLEHSSCPSFKSIFIEVYLSDNELHRFKGYSLISFACLHP